MQQILSKIKGYNQLILLTILINGKKYAKKIIFIPTVKITSKTLITVIFC
jgi:hypothetical protein